MYGLLTATLTKRLNAAHHRWQRSMLGISWKDRVKMKRLESELDNKVWTTYSVKEDSTGWTCDTNGLPAVHIPRQALHWEFPGFKRGPGHPRTNWRSTVNKDLLRMGITWEKVEVAAQNRSEWRRSVAQCMHVDAG